MELGQFAKFSVPPCAKEAKAEEMRIQILILCSLLAVCWHHPSLRISQDSIVRPPAASHRLTEISCCQAGVPASTDPLSAASFRYGAA